MESIDPGAPATAASDYVSEASFDEMGLSEPVRRAVAERGYVHPTPVQAATFKPARQGKDMIVRSKTGTGKTAAFALPILERIPDGRRKPSALVMAPTRELALQVADEFAALAKHRDLRVAAIYGGASMSEQLAKLQDGAEIIVGTPGRIYDHIRRKTLRLDQAMVSVLDEADEMLNMGFFEEVTRILDQLPEGCQQLLFSATVPADIEQIIREHLKDPETILLSGDEFKVDNIVNVMYPTVDAYPKPRNLLYMIETEEPESAIVFCNTRNDTSLVSAVLNRNGYDAELLNGDLPQKERERVMAKVKRGELRFMVATDIAARGIDISDLSHVINYSLPEDPAVYLHRVGRTGRMSKKGTALSLVSGAELNTLTALQKKYGVVFEQRTLPTAEQARKVWTDRHVAELKDAMSASIFEAYIPLAQELKGRGDGEYLLAFALKYFFTHHRIEKVADREKAEHKREEHERKEHRVEHRAEGRGEGRGERSRGRGGEREGGRGGRERRGDRLDRGDRRPRNGELRVSAERPSADLPATPAVEVAATSPAHEAEAEDRAPQGPPRSRIFLSLGEQDGADEAKVREAVAALAPGVEVLGVELRRSHAFVLVSPEAQDAAVGALHGKDWNGKALTAEKARRRRR
ncbi:MAG TPA: DEAD/DEAH box helicase [Anaeromyxobacteraceae bacterium]|nr:DEAD/DEAH box helicase [Anaeromyxobacteraceae bacterium]